MAGRRDNIEWIRSRLGSQLATGLEISPNIAPMFPKKGSYRMEYLDVCSTEQLRERVVAKGRAAGSTPEIDYLYDYRRPIAECVGGKQYDFVASSHVIEHVPDLIGHFREVQDLLVDGGRYALLVPDRDLCFDAFKPSTTLGQLVEAHLQARRTVPVSALIDEYHYGRKKAGKGAWARGSTEPSSQKYGNARQLIADVIRNPGIAANWHGHVWRFTPAEFGALIDELGALGLIGFQVEEVQATDFMEFIAILRLVRTSASA